MIPRRIFWLFDLVILVFAFFTANWLFPFTYVVLAQTGIAQPGATLLIQDIFWMSMVVMLGSLVCMEVLNGYSPLLRQSRFRILWNGLISPFAGLGLATMVLFAAKDPGPSRLFAFTFAIVSSCFLIGYRSLLRLYFKQRAQRGYYARPTLLVGSTPVVEWLVDYFTDNVSPIEYRLIGYLKLLPQSQNTNATVPIALPCLGTADQLGDLLVHHPIREVIAVQSDGSTEWLKKVVQDCDYFRVSVRIVPEALLGWEARDLKLLVRQPPLNLPAIVLISGNLDSDALFVKRLFDIIVSGIALLLLLPVFIVIAIAIKLTTPELPVFYPWRVVGKNGVEFTGYKFTTMKADADIRKEDLLALNEMTGPVFKIKNDPRVTSLGRFLRKYSLNELPQLWSVFKGDMSLVGPRPAFPHELERYEFWQKRKLSIRPGITCLWQVRGRNKISNFDDWVRMDLEYIDNWSLWLDLRILIRTAWAVIGGTGS